MQAWHGQYAWMPPRDDATVYEDMGVLNDFRGILLRSTYGLRHKRNPAAWCENVLRMVTPHMWLCRNLIEQVDRATLERVASVSECNDSYKVEKREGCAMDDLELALLPILPIESVRMTVRD